MENENQGVYLYATDIQWDVDIEYVLESLQDMSFRKAAEAVECDPDRWGDFNNSEKYHYAKRYFSDEAHRAEFMELPSVVEIPSVVVREQQKNDDAISNWLSDEFGFCHEGFVLKWEMVSERKQELLDKLIAYVGSTTDSLFEQVSVLQSVGFSNEDLLALGFDEGVLG